MHAQKSGDVDSNFLEIPEIVSQDEAHNQIDLIEIADHFLNASIPHEYTSTIINARIILALYRLKFEEIEKFFRAKSQTEL